MAPSSIRIRAARYASLPIVNVCYMVRHKNLVSTQTHIHVALN